MLTKTFPTGTLVPSTKSNTMRQTKLLSDLMSGLLLKQLKHELQNFQLYTSFSNFFAIKGIIALEDYFAKQAAGEKSHHDWVYSYLNEADCRVKYPSSDIGELQNVTSIMDPFTKALAREVETTQMIYTVYEAALAEKDYMTASWLLEKLIKEQIEEENISRMAITIMSLDSDILIRADKVLALLG